MMPNQEYLLVYQEQRWRSYPVSPSSMILGAAPECDIQIDQPDISAQQAILSNTPFGLLLRNLQPGWPIAVNSLNYDEFLLYHNDTLTIGDLFFARYLQRPPTPEDESQTGAAHETGKLRRDFLSGLTTAWLFYQSLGDLSGSAATILFNIDKFKSVNDFHGFAAGDAVIRYIGAILRTQVPASYFGARITGDRFAIVLPGADHANTAKLAENIRDLVEKSNIHQTKATIRGIIAPLSKSPDPATFFSWLSDQLDNKGRGAHNKIHTG